MAAQSQDVRQLLIGLGVILLVLAGFFYFKSKRGQEATSSPSPEEIIVQEEGAVKKVGGLVQPLSEEELKKMHEEVDAVLAAGGDTASLKDVAQTGVTGQAQRAYSDGKFYHKLTLNGLKAIEKGYYYESWLGKDGEVFSTGRVEVDEAGKGQLYYTASTDKTAYSQVIVTIEPDDGNPAPATHILEGEF